MRSQGRWEEVLREDAADEEAHRALMRRRVASGDRPAAARQFRLLRDELSRLGAEPSEETLALQRELTRGPAVRAARLLHAPVEGRERELALGARRASACRGRRRRRAARHGLARDRQDAPRRGRARRGGGARLSHAARRRPRGGGPRAVRAACGGARPARRAAPGAGRRAQPTAHRPPSRDCCPRCAARRGRRRSPWIAIASSRRSPSCWGRPPRSAAWCS